MKKILILTPLILIIFSCNSPKLKPLKVSVTKPMATDNESILGTWISEEDSNWHLVITSNKYYSHYTGQKTDTCSYSISNTSPQCGIQVPIRGPSGYIGVVNDRDTTDKFAMRSQEYLLLYYL